MSGADGPLGQIPERIEGERIYLRCYRDGDGPRVHSMGRKNRAHLARCELGNALMSLGSEADAEIVVCGHVADWLACNGFFMAAFD